MNKKKKEQTCPVYNFRSDKIMKHLKNVFKYKNKTTFLGKLRKKFLSAINYRFDDVVVAKHEVSVETFKYLNRHLVKLNRALKGFLFISLNKSKYAGGYGYTVVVSLKVIR